MNEMGSTPRVLVVEDEFLISAMVAECCPSTAARFTSRPAPRTRLQHLTCGAPCDVLFTDINLPGGVDGATLAQLARQLRPDLPVVYASGLVTAIEQLNAVPGATFVPKPYDPDKVCALLQQFAAQHSTESDRLSVHAAFGQETLEPVDVVVAVDDVLLAHQLAEQRQRGLDAVDHEFVERALAAASGIRCASCRARSACRPASRRTAGSCSPDRPRNRPARRARRADGRTGSFRARAGRSTGSPH